MVSNDPLILQGKKPELKPNERKQEHDIQAKIQELTKAGITEVR
jgi:hypothetical protein